MRLPVANANTKGWQVVDKQKQEEEQMQRRTAKPTFILYILRLVFPFPCFIRRLVVCLAVAVESCLYTATLLTFFAASLQDHLTMTGQRLNPAYATVFECFADILEQRGEHWCVMAPLLVFFNQVLPFKRFGVACFTYLFDVCLLLASLLLFFPFAFVQIPLAVL